MKKDTAEAIVKALDACGFSDKYEAGCDCKWCKAERKVFVRECKKLLDRARAYLKSKKGRK